MRTTRNAASSWTVAKRVRLALNSSTRVAQRTRTFVRLGTKNRTGSSSSL